MVPHAIRFHFPANQIHALTPESDFTLPHRTGNTAGGLAGGLRCRYRVRGLEEMEFPAMSDRWRNLPLPFPGCV